MRGVDGSNGVKSTRGSNNEFYVHLAVHPVDGFRIILNEYQNSQFPHLSPTGQPLAKLCDQRSFQCGIQPQRTSFLAKDGAASHENPGRSFRVIEYPDGHGPRKQVDLEKHRQPFVTFCLDDAAVATAATAGGDCDLGLESWHAAPADCR